MYCLREQTIPCVKKDLLWLEKHLTTPFFGGFICSCVTSTGQAKIEKRPTIQWFCYQLCAKFQLVCGFGGLEYVLFDSTSASVPLRNTMC